MRIFDTIKGRAAIQVVADREGKSYAEIEAEIQETIDEVWGKPEFAEYQNTIFPKGKPTAAEFVGRMACHVKATGLCAEEGMPI